MEEWEEDGEGKEEEGGKRREGEEGGRGGDMDPEC